MYDEFDPHIFLVVFGSTITIPLTYFYSNDVRRTTRRLELQPPCFVSVEFWRGFTVTAAIFFSHLRFKHSQPAAGLQKILSFKKPINKTRKRFWRPVPAIGRLPLREPDRSGALSPRGRSFCFHLR